MRVTLTQAAGAGLRENSQIKEKKIMRMKQNKKSLSFLFCMMLIVAMALCISGCNGKKTQETQVASGREEMTQEAGTPEQTEEIGNQAVSEAVTVMGEGETKFFFTVMGQEGTETSFEIHTDKDIVGEALLELGLISGEESEFGHFVKSVNDIVADFEIDGTYWAFYVNGEYAMSGVDTTTIEEDASYMLKVEK